MPKFTIEWTETRSASFSFDLSAEDVIEVFAEHLPEVLTDAITDAIDGAYLDVERMAPVLEALRERAGYGGYDEFTVDDLNDTSASLAD